MSVQQFTLHHVDLSKLVRNPFIIVLGRKVSGKTTVAKHIVESHKAAQVTVFSGNEHNMCEWSDVTDDVHIADINKLEDIKKEQEQKVRADRESYGGKSYDYQVPDRLRKWIVFDDVCGYKKRFCWSELVNEFACNHRFMGISMIFTCQYFNQLPPGVRDQLDYIAMLQTRNDNNIKKVYKHHVIPKDVTNESTFRSLHNAIADGPGKALWIDDTMERKLGYLHTVCHDDEPQAEDDAAGTTE